MYPIFSGGNGESCLIGVGLLCVGFSYWRGSLSAPGCGEQWNLQALADDVMNILHSAFLLVFFQFGSSSGLSQQSLIKCVSSDWQGGLSCICHPQSSLGDQPSNNSL